MTNSEAQFKQAVKRLYQLTVYSRWLFVGICWLILAPMGIWGLRDEFILWREYFTWAALRYGLAYNILPSFCLAFCVGITTAVLVWQSSHIIWGIPKGERKRLEKQVRKIRQKGPSHPLWKWTFGTSHHFNANGN